MNEWSTVTANLKHAQITPSCFFDLSIQACKQDTRYAHSGNVELHHQIAAVYTVGQKYCDNENRSLKRQCKHCDIVYSYNT